MTDKICKRCGYSMNQPHRIKCVVCREPLHGVSLGRSIPIDLQRMPQELKNILFDPESDYHLRPNDITYFSLSGNITTIEIRGGVKFVLWRRQLEKLTEYGYKIDMVTNCNGEINDEMERNRPVIAFKRVVRNE